MKMVSLTEDDSLPEGLLDNRLIKFYDPDNALAASQLIDLQSGNEERGICACHLRQSDNQTIYFNEYRWQPICFQQCLRGNPPTARVQDLSKSLNALLKIKSLLKVLLTGYPC